VLGELAKRTQVLLFTHHQHHVTIARESLGQLIPVVVLGTGDTPTQVAHS
jgi:hypothetical protein